MEFYGSTHNHTDRSNFRLRDSTNSLKELCWYAAKLGHQFIAITDHETVSTAIDCQFIEKEIREKYPNFKVIRGNEIYLCRNGLNKDNYVKGEDFFYHWILLAKDEEGHRQIRELSSRAWLRSFKQGKNMRVPTYYSDLIEIIGANPGHVIMQQSCLGGKLSKMEVNYINEPIEEKWNYILEWVKHIQQICGKENFFLEVQPARTKDQLAVYQATLKLEEETKIPVMISLDAHYLNKDDEPIHHAFLTAQDGERETEEFYATTYMMSTDEIHSIMDSAIGAEKVSNWLNNSKIVYDLCEDYDLTKPTRIVYLPKTVDTISENEFNLFKDKIHELEYFYRSKHKENKDLAAAIVRKILNDKTQYDNEATYLAIDDNLKAIRLASEKMNTQWSAYLLNMRDYIQIIWEKGDSLVGPSRGCFYPNEKVLLSNGTEKNICDIKAGEKVINHNGSINEVKEVYKYDIKEECYVVKGKGKEEVHCTNNHKFYIKRCSSCDNSSYKNNWCKETCRRSGICPYKKSHEVGFVPANELRVGDLLAYPKPKLPPLQFSTIDLADYIAQDKYIFIEEKVVGYYVGNNTIVRKKEIQRFLPINEELAYVCGVFIGNGWTKKSEDNEVGFAFHSENEKDLASLKRCENFFMSLGLRVAKSKHKTKKLIQMRIYSKVFCRFFRKNFGEDTYKKHVCDWLISSNSRITKSLLLGLMASDGHYDKDRICYDSVNKQLIRQVQLLWASIGIFGNYKTRIPKNENWCISYKWTASGKQLERLVDDFPLVNISEKKYSRQDYLEDNDCFYTPIESIKTEIYEGPVYDLNVENVHSYVINGNSVHNSGMGFILLNILNITQINPLREKTKTYSFRFLNPERVSPLDIDIDIEGGKRPQVYKALQEAYGEDRVSKVLTIRTEKPKSAILTAARGLGVDPDIASYLASFIKSDRGIDRTLEQTYYGDVEEGILPDKKFQELMDGEYNSVWKVARRIAGLCCGVGSHAGGVIFYDEPITNTTALMKTSNGDIITQYDLHKLEDVSLLKIDLLSIEALDKIRACIDLLTEYNYIDKTKTLRERYEEAVGVYNIERDNPKMWELIYEHKIQSLFQMEQDSGIKGIAAVKPETVDDLAALNAVIRLMAQEGQKEQPVDKFARFKKDINEWYKELKEWKVKEEYWPLLKNIVGITYGMCIQQEQFMILVQQPELGGFSLLWSDKLRKSIAKKDPKGFDNLEKEFYQVTKEKGCDYNLCNYVWQCLIKLNKGYGFNASHTAGYSIVALQEMNLAYKYPIIFWNTANLIVDSGSMNLQEEINLDEDEDDDEKIENSSCNYGKIATAIGKMKASGINFTLPNINTSGITYSPNVEENVIVSGLRGISRIGNQLIKEIILKRPYSSIEDFLQKVKVNKTQMINLIKAGCFDALYSQFNREKIMAIYLEEISDKKKRITLQNMQMLITKNLIPPELSFEVKVYNFNRYLKANKKEDYYYLDNIAFSFYITNYNEDLLEDVCITGDESTALILQKKWNAIYKKEMDTVRAWIKTNYDDILSQLNTTLLNEVTEKYANGNISKWEMDSLSFYYHEHELANLKTIIYNVKDYFQLNPETKVEREVTTKKGDKIPIYQISRIAGTVIDKDKKKSTVTLLTTTGVVNVKVWKNQFAEWDKQISEVGVDGKKHVLEKSWFQRGTKLIITGIRRGDNFVPKKYRNTEWPLFERIDELSENGFILKSATQRIDAEED